MFSVTQVTGDSVLNSKRQKIMVSKL